MQQHRVTFNASEPLVKSIHQPFQTMLASRRQQTLLGSQFYLRPQSLIKPSTRVTCAPAAFDSTKLD